ncbi:MAG: asparaginase [Chitinophagaceae bacterium]|nr:asparaginase [Chitinophagaceae bacterium]
MKSINYKITTLTDTNKKNTRSDILVIYTGGTIGMVHGKNGVLQPFNFENMVQRIPELNLLDIKITVISFPKPIDSSNIDIKDWQSIGDIIEQNYAQYDGFVILHGTDTMSYSASALSYLLENLNKPVIFTGAQIPISSIRTDAKENFITALEIAADTKNNTPIISEVCIYFNFSLMRGNRSQKVKSSQFAAFDSPHYPFLAESGVSIEYNFDKMAPYKADTQLKTYKNFDTNVTILKLFPGINKHIVESIFAIKGLKGIILESYGSGNIINEKWLISCLKKNIDRGIIVFNVSQCVGGTVVHGKYETSSILNDIGVLSGGDITTEAAVTKLMFLLSREKDIDSVKTKLVIPLAGEMK